MKNRLPKGHPNSVACLFWSHRCGGQYRSQAETPRVSVEQIGKGSNQQRNQQRNQQLHDPSPKTLVHVCSFRY